MNKGINMTSNITQRDSFVGRLLSAEIDPFAVPIRLQDHYAGIPLEDVAALAVAAGRDLGRDGERALRRLIVALLDATAPPRGWDRGNGAEHGVGVLTLFGGDVLFNPHGVRGALRAEERAMGETVARFVEEARGEGMPYRLAMHHFRLELAEDAAVEAERATAQEAKSRAEHTDPVIDRYDLRVYGEVKRGAVFPGATTDIYGDGAWTVKATPLVRWLIGQEVARQLMERDPELAATVGAEAAVVLENNGLLGAAR